MPYDQQMVDALLDYLLRMDETEHGMDGVVREAARQARAIRGPQFYTRRKVSQKALALQDRRNPVVIMGGRRQGKSEMARQVEIRKELNADVEFLIRQLDVLEHLQDREGISKIAKKYGIKRTFE